MKAVRILLILVAVALPAAAKACSIPIMLDFVGSLEAPEGYDQVYSGITHEPPRPITRMTVGEVLDWQAETVRTSVSSAAGRYQVIRPTLQSMVDLGVVSRSDIYSPQTQDRIGAYLLTDAGFGDPSLSAEQQANRIAGVWAALPQVSGGGSGTSVYQGVAGNRALTAADTYMGVLTCEIGLEEAVTASRMLESWRVRILNFDVFLEQVSDIVARMAPFIAQAALGLLLALATIDAALAFGKATLRGDHLGPLIGSKGVKLVIVGFFAFLLSEADGLVRMVAETATDLADLGLGGFSFSFGTIGREKMLAIFALVEWAQAMGAAVFAAMIVIAMLLVAVSALQLGTLAFYYAQAFLKVTVALFGFGFGGFEYTRDIALRCLKAFLGAALSLTTAILVVMVTIGIARDLREASATPLMATTLLMLELIALVLLLSLPRAAASLAR